MLEPTQVIALLDHSDQILVDGVIAYFGSAHDPAPATADTLWAAYDRSTHRKNRSWLIEVAARLPQTDTSISRVLKELTQEHDVSGIFYLLHTLQAVPIKMLQDRKEEILAAPMPEHVRIHLESRLSMSETPAEELWELLQNQANIIDDEASDDDRSALRLVEALERNPDIAIPATMKILADKSNVTSLVRYAIQLLGHFRHTPAVDLLVGRLDKKDEEAGFSQIPESAADALLKFPASLIIPKLRHAYPEATHYFKMAITELLEKFKLPEAEEALFQLLQIENDIELKSMIAYSLTEIFTNRPEILEQLRQMVINNDYDRQQVNLEHELVLLCNAVGYNPPEAGQWRENVSEYRRQIEDDTEVEVLLAKEYTRWIETGSLNPGEDDDEEDSEDEESEDDEWDWVAGDKNRPAFADDEEVAETDDLRPPAIEPFRRTAPKVGRNEPCPCGSGKKYKKCCGK